MNSCYSQKACQNQNDESQVYKSQKTGPRMTCVNKKMNTPPEFLVCQQCQQIIGKKSNPVPVQMTVGDCGVGFSEYTKALNYINSCHTIINKMINRIQDTNSETTRILSMPDLPNFIDLFSSIHKIEPNLQEQEEVNVSYCNNLQETPKSDEEMCDSSEESDDKAQRQEEQKPTYKRGNYLFSDPKQNENQKVKYVSPDNSGPTTENEDSETELDLRQPSKCKPVTLQNKKEKVIYEEINNRDEDSLCNNQTKREEEVCHRQNVSPEFCSARTKKNSNIPERIKNIPPRSREGTCITPSTNAVQKRIKPRSASAKPNNYVSPEEKKKSSFEINANYSDTALSVKNTTKSNDKAHEKSLVQSVSFQPDSALSRQDLDKYAKELLRSRTASQRPNSRNSGSKQPTRPKTEEKSKMQPSKPPGITKTKQVDFKKRLKSHQERQMHLSPKYQPVQTQTIVMQQNGPKRHKNVFTAVSNHKMMTESQQTDEQHLLRNTPKHHNLGLSQSQNTTTYLHSSTVTNLHSSGKTNTSVSPTIMCSTQSTKMSPEEDPRSAQKQYKRYIFTGPPTHAEVNCQIKSPDKVPEAHQCIPQMNHQLRSRQTCLASSNENDPEDDDQYCFMYKKNDFFTSHDNVDNRHLRTSTNLNHVYNNAEEMNVESDDIKTDSDIDDDHFNNEETGKKSISNPSAQNILDFFPSCQMTLEIEQLKKEAKSKHANDEMNRPFREPRKTVNEREDSEIVKMSDTYPTPRVMNIGRTQSEESSDIKSDNEDGYLRVRTVNCNCCSANQYRQI